ncbi:MAG: class I SAM-dependent methyltransferase [Candidatus Lambdaproteobacteria bacterium]|nr:class I SAM-dependent methyltransferase [Candidatus Lambdaproteobacteria bacterium]
MMRAYAWLIEQQLAGSSIIPRPALDALMKLMVELHYRFSPTYSELPCEWSGDSGPIAEQSEDLMRVHYDKPLIVFENFLGPTMKYTMALYERGARTLEQAQEDMLDDLCTKVGLQNGEEVLDIACGFGSLSTYIMRHYPKCKVTALNLSKVQVDYIASKQNEPGHPLHADRFRIIQEDFATAKLDRQFDRIMVIGLFEHIRNLKLALEKISRFLKPAGSVLLHYIAYNRIIEPMANPTQDLFFGKYIFPGGRFWYFRELFRYQDHLRIENSWFLNGNNYKRTLEVWLENFWHNIDKIRTHPDIDERFIRTWDLYLRFCIAIFGGMGGRNVGNGQYLLRHAGPAH